MNVPVFTPFKCPLSVCSGLTDAVRWLVVDGSSAVLLRGREEVDGESERRI